MGNDDERVRERAHQLWEQAGCPEGRSLEFWYAAVRELQAEFAPSQLVVEPGVPDEAPEPVALRPIEKPAAAPPEPPSPSVKPAAAPRKRAR